MRRLNRILKLHDQSVWCGLVLTIAISGHSSAFLLAQPDQPMVQVSDNSLRKTIQKLLDAGKISEAEETVKQELDEGGESAEVWFLEGMVLFKRKQFAESMQRVERSLALRQSDPEVYKLLAFNAVLLNRLEIVEAALRKALELAPDDPVAHFHQGLLYYTTNRFGLAESEFQRVIQLDPKYMKAYDMLGLAQEELEDDAVVIRTYQQAIELTEQQKVKDGSAYLHLAKFLWLRNRFEESLPAARRAVELNPKSAEAYYVLGRVLDKLGRDLEAKEALDQSIRIDPDYSESHYLLSRIYVRQGNQEEAAKSMKMFEEGKKRSSVGRLSPERNTRE
jgi:tetratricopeptide (TPR) repeat protein